MAASTPNVLIVESDARQTEIITELIRELGRANIDSTDSGERATQLVSRSLYQIVIADAGIGDTDILTLLERIKRVSPSTAVILTSAFATIEESVKAIRAGADEYFKKPYNPEQFKFAVRTCLDRRDLYSGDSTVTGMMLLLNACQLVSSSLEEDRVIETVMGYLHRETAGKGIALFRKEGEGFVNVSAPVEVDADVIDVLVQGHNFLQVCFEDKSPMKVVPKTSSAPEIAVFQFQGAANVQYFVVSIAPSWASPANEVDSRFRLLQAQIQMTSKNISNYRGVRHLLHLDEPTGLFNTRYMHRCLDAYFTKYQKGETKEFSVLFIDVDKFKNINDSHGHLIGTKLLFEIGEILRKHTRKSDILFRYGGDEFVALLPDMESAAAFKTAERIRAEVEGNEFLSKEGLNVKLTLSIGLASCPEHAISKRDIIEAADQAMYAVKRKCRNSVYIAEKKAA